MSMNAKTLLAATAAGTLALASAQAATIAEYTFTGGSTASTGALGSDIDFEVGITGSDTSLGDLRITGLDTAGPAIGGASYTDPDASRIASENWVTFSITVPDTQTLDLTSLNFDYTDINPARFLLGVYSSETGFTEGDHLLGLFPATANSYSVVLSGITALQDLTDETVEFRFLLGDNSGATSRIHVLDNITLNGTVSAIPEPSSFVALLGLGALSVVLCRRRCS